MDSSHKVKVVTLGADGLEKFLGPRELSILEYMWSAQRNPGRDGRGWTVAEIRSRLRLDGVTLSATGVQTTMNRMYYKGLLLRVQRSPDSMGTRYFYSPVLSEEALAKLAVSQTLDSLITDYADFVDEYFNKERQI